MKRELSIPTNPLPGRNDIIKAKGAGLDMHIQSLEASLAPTSHEIAKKATVILIGQSKVAPGTLPNPEIFALRMQEALARYPADIYDALLLELEDAEDWLPSIKAVTSVCKRIVKDRQDMLRLAKIRRDGIRGDSDYEFLLEQMVRYDGPEEEVQDEVIRLFRKGSDRR
jgi:hypothetical protein